MTAIESMSTSEALSYLGISRSTLQRYEREKKIKPLGTNGTTKMWSVADLNILREEMTRKKLVSKSPVLSAGSSGTQGEKTHQEALQKITEMVTQAVVVDMDTDVSEEKQRKLLERKLQDAFRARIAEILSKTNAVEIIAADLYHSSPKVRHEAFSLMAKYFLPQLQAMSVERVGESMKKESDSRAAEAIRRIEAVEKKQEAEALLRGPIRILDGETNENLLTAGDR